MKNEIMKLLYNQILEMGNKYLVKWEGHKDEFTISLVVGGFLKFIHDELEIE